MRSVEGRFMSLLNDEEKNNEERECCRDTVLRYSSEKVYSRERLRVFFSFTLRSLRIRRTDATARKDNELSWKFRIFELDTE